MSPSTLAPKLGWRGAMPTLPPNSQKRSRPLLDLKRRRWGREYARMRENTVTVHSIAMRRAATVSQGELNALSSEPRDMTARRSPAPRPRSGLRSRLVSPRMSGRPRRCSRTPTVEVTLQGVARQDAKRRLVLTKVERGWGGRWCRLPISSGRCPQGVRAGTALKARGDARRVSRNVEAGVTSGDGSVASTP